MFGWFRRKKQKNVHRQEQELPMSQRLRRTGESSSDVNTYHHNDSFDSSGFAFGVLTGVPYSPTQGFSVGAMVGAAAHEAAHDHHESMPASSYSSPDPTPSVDSGPSPSYDSGSSSNSYDSGTSSSFDSGGTAP